MHRFCEGRLLDRHVGAGGARSTAAAATLLVAALRPPHAGGRHVDGARGGFSLLLTLPAGLERQRAPAAAIERGVAFTPGRSFFVDGSGERTLRLSFSSVPGDRIDEGVRRLAETIKAALVAGGPPGRRRRIHALSARVTERGGDRARGEFKGEHRTS